MHSGIYVIRNKETGKVYVGSTKNFEKRWKEHLVALRNSRHSSIKLQRSYDKHGEAVFVFEVVEEVPYQKPLIVEREDHWIDVFDSRANGYNISPASFGDVLSQHPEKDAIVERITKSVQARYAAMSDEERKRKHGQPGSRNGMFGKTHSEGARRRISEANTGVSRNIGWKMSLEQREAISRSAKERTGERNPFYGKTHSDEFKKRMSEQRLGKKPANTNTVVIDGVEYLGLEDASAATGVNRATIRHRALSKNPKFSNYYYKDYVQPPKKPKRAGRPGQPSPNRKSVVVDGVRYESAQEAAEQIGLSRHVMYRRLRSPKYPNYDYE